MTKPPDGPYVVNKRTKKTHLTNKQGEVRCGARPRDRSNFVTIHVTYQVKHADKCFHCWSIV